MAKRASLKARIGADTSDFEKAAKKMAKAMAPVQKKLKETGSMLTKSLTGPILGVTAALGALTHKTAGYADRVDKMSQRLGMSRKAFQEWDFVLSQNGVNIESMQMGMKSLAQRMEEASRGAGMGAEMFARLGVSVRESDGSMRKQEDVFKDTIIALQNMEEGVEKAALAQKLFGRNGQELLPMLNTTKGSVEELMETARELGLVMGDDAIDAGVKYTDMMDQVKRQMQQVGMQLGNALMPLFNDVFIPTLQKKVIPALSKVAEKIADLIEWFKELDRPAQIAIGAFVGLAITIGPALMLMAKMIAIAPKVAAAWTLMTGPVGLTVMAVAAAGVAFFVFRDQIRVALYSAAGAVMDFAARFIDRLAAVTRYMGSLESVLGVKGPMTLLADQLDKAADKARGMADGFRDMAAAAREAMKPVSDVGRRVNEMLFGGSAPGGASGGTTPDPDPDPSGKVRSFRDVINDLNESLNLTRLRIQAGVTDSLSAARDKANALGSAITDALRIEGRVTDSIREMVAQWQIASAAAMDIEPPDLDFEPLKLGFQEVFSEADQLRIKVFEVSQAMDLGLYKSVSQVDAALGTLQTAFDEAISQEARDNLREMIDLLLDARNEMQGLEDKTIDLGSVLRSGLNDAIAVVAESFGTLVADIFGVFGGARDAIMEEIRETEQAIAEQMARGAAASENSIRSLNQRLAGLREELSETGFSVANVARGLLGVFADVMAKLGGLLVAFGTAGVLFNANGGFLSFLANPFAAIAAGAILIGASTAIKAALSSGNASAGGMASGGVSSIEANANASFGRAERQRNHFTFDKIVLPNGDVEVTVREASRRAGRHGTLVT